MLNGFVLDFIAFLQGNTRNKLLYDDNDDDDHHHHDDDDDDDDDDGEGS